MPGGSLAGQPAALYTGAGWWLAARVPTATLGMRWFRAVCFERAVRVRGAGNLLATAENASCGLCGHVLSGAADSLDTIVAEHVLS